MPANVKHPSPPRQRRPSEFLNPSSEGRKMPIIGGRASGHVSSLSTSASMISPLNPLPSPWETNAEGQITSPPHLHSVEPSSSAQSSMSGAMRLNRVPASVRMAGELMKSSSAQNQPSTNSSSTATSTGSVNTPNPSPAGSLPNIGSMPPPSSTRPLGATASMPPPSTTTSDSTASRPNLTVPVTPLGTAGNKKGLSPTASINSEGGGVNRKPSASSLAPPSSFRGSNTSPSGPLRPRPSLPPDPAGLGEPFSSRAHKYRTSMHEQHFKAGSSLLSDSSSQWSPASEAESSTSVSTAQSKNPALGLGFNMPPVTAILQKTHGLAPASGTLTPEIHEVLRPKHSATKGLHMDLAGLPGDAASHANMILQSRQAKLQKWRPNSSGSQASSRYQSSTFFTDRSQNGDEKRPHAFGQLSSVGDPAAPVHSKANASGQWQLKAGGAASPASAPGEDLPPFNLPTANLQRITSSPDDPSPKTQDTGKLRDPPHPGPSSLVVPSGSFGMERQQSAGGGTVGGIEWVDWYDCYKRYKEEKIRAEAEAARAKIPPIGESSNEGVDLTLPSTSTSPTTTEGAAGPYGPTMDQHTHPAAESTSALALSPSTSRDDAAAQSSGLRRRSMSIRSSLSAMDPSRSPSQKRTSIFERSSSRQVSGGSARSAAESTSSAVKRKKNLATKMEGWWNAVKSNFGPESPRGSPTMQAHGRVPSAPVSRALSIQPPLPPPPVPMPVAAHLAPQQSLGSRREAASQSIRQVTSHNELRSTSGRHDAAQLQEAASIVSSTSADIASMLRDTSKQGHQTLRETRPSMMSLQGRKPSMVPEEPSQVPSRTTSSLEVRRKGGLNLRLELEPNIFARHNVYPAGGSSASTHQSLPTESSNTTGDLRSSQQMYNSGGLTPGAPRWDESPSPLFAASTESNSPAVLKEDHRPVAPGAEISVANVRRHIKHRLEAAKVACDHTLRKTIDAITRFADEQKAQEQAELASATTSVGLDDQPRDYFEVMALRDSPVLDTEYSDAEGPSEGIVGSSRSRNPSASVPVSRRASLSRDRFASPSKRSSMIPASPNRVRRRPSNNPRNGQSAQRLSRNLSLSLDRSVSASSSRSTSRSRSPMPTSSRGVLLGRSQEDTEGSKLFLTALQDLIVFAHDILDMSVNALVTRPTETTEIIQKLQQVGSRWDDHDDWPGREWYVDILMAIANLNRVLDWWEAEKGFWNFDDEDADEPIMFVVKPAAVGVSRENSNFDNDFRSALTDSGDSPLISTLQVPEPPSSAVSLEVPSPDTSGPGGTARQLGTSTPRPLQAEDLKFLAEHAKSVNIVMELGLQGEDIQYVNDAILEVTG